MKKQIGVIFGSRSCEREVAIISAVQLMRHADREKYEIIPVYISDDGNWYTGDKLTDIQAYKPFRPDQKGIIRVFPDLSSGSGALLTIRKNTGLFAREKTEIVARIDAYIIVMHGLNGEDGTLQGLMELINVPYTSTGVAGSALGMDKIMMKQFFQGAGLPVLPGLSFTRSEFSGERGAVLNKVEEELGFPVFVKPANLGSSIGVSRADDTESLADSLELAFEYDRRVLVEKGLDKPIELNCSVMGYDDIVEASPIEMPLNNDEFLDFKDKYLASGGSKGMASLHRVLPAPIEDELKNEIQEMSRTIFRMLDCKGVVRIDYMFDKHSEKLYITEINTIPGSLAFYLWENAGIPYSALIDRMINFAEKAHADKNQSNYAYSSDILKNVSLGSKGAKGCKGMKYSK
ncbi:D-alanine--D-alanine ligase family protein [Aristaeella hokkaidonensis]|uniref:D-alanine--D-alanine ligase n=1 Tax=Aristaeella hokkaidonensis TaxID=3046382 RepID=A0AC61N4A9_9FIRM|nr:D-alanine--D-alanine ligase family protein [Aristaeella hokkaidonensis]MBQ6288733.1 D-alanine--D-alanine ligase [Clostridia bacterium]QUC67935.1 D-alanine--D-alanine ligase [Aristaeella hokkaidonensis]SNT93002.1 D-alanine--D-alanine ligase [Aristaeella hokkaidonensis]